MNMKVLLINGSPNREGCTFTALGEVAATLQKHGIVIGSPVYEPGVRTHFIQEKY